MKEWLLTGLRMLFIVCICYIILDPLLTKLSMSFMDKSDVYDSMVKLIPKHFTLVNYVDAYQYAKYGQVLLDTVILCALSALMLTTAALAEAPESQFGLTGWPYRQETDCTTNGVVIPTQCPENGENCPDNDTSLDIPATDSPVAPTPLPTSAPEATAVPTKAPSATKAPSTDDDYTTQSTSAQEQMMLNLLKVKENELQRIDH